MCMEPVGIGTYGAWYPSSFLAAVPISHMGTTLRGLGEL